MNKSHHFSDSEDSNNEDNKSSDSSSDSKKMRKKKPSKPTTYVDDDGLQCITIGDTSHFKHPNDRFNLFPDGSVRIVINGKSGTGKSTLLLKLIPMLAKPKNIIICTTVEMNPVHEAIKNYCEAHDIKYSVCYDPNEFMEKLEEIVSRKKDKPKRLKEHDIIIFDDFSDSHTSKDNAYNNATIRAFQKYRNYNISCILISPHITDAKTNVRASSNIKILFPVVDCRSYDSWFRDISIFFPKLNNIEFQKLYKYICDNKFNFIMFCDNPEPHLRINWDKQAYSAKNIENNEVSGGAARKRGNPKVLTRKYQLMAEALDKGLPSHFRNIATIKQLERFIMLCNKKHDGHYENNNFREVEEMLGPHVLSQKNIIAALRVQIKKYRKNNDERYLIAIDRYGKMLIDSGYDSLALRRFLEKNDIPIDE